MQQMSAETPRPPSHSTCKRGEGLAPSKKNQGVLFACPSVRPPASPFARSPPRSPNISCHLYHDAGVVRILIERLKQRCISIKSIATSLRRGVLEISSAKAAPATKLSCQSYHARYPRQSYNAEHVLPSLPSSPQLAPMDQSHKPKLLVMPADPDIGHAVRGPLWAAAAPSLDS